MSDPQTPIRAGPSMVNIAAQLRAEMTPFSPSESKYPTPPSSSPLPHPLQNLKPKPQSTLATPRRKPLARREPSATPSHQCGALPEVTFTPFHDLKQTIDEWIGDLPADFEGLVNKDDEVFVERRRTNNGTQLSLIFCSPAKKGVSSPRKKDNGDESTPTRQPRGRVTRVPISPSHSEGPVDWEELWEKTIGEVDRAAESSSSQGQITDGIEESRFSDSEADTGGPTVSSPTTKRHRSLLRKTGRVLKKTIKLLIPRGVHTKRGRRTAGMAPIDEDANLTQTDDTPVTTLRPAYQVLYHPDSPPTLPPTPAKRPSPSIPHETSAYPLPIITASSPNPFRVRSLGDIISTTRKPLPQQSPPPHLLPIQRVTALKSPGRIVSGMGVESEYGSFYDLVALQESETAVEHTGKGESEMELEHASKEVKAVASLSVMAMAAGADFLREDEMVMPKRGVGQGSGRKASLRGRQVRMPS